MTKDPRPDRIVTAKERRNMIPYSDMHIYRLERAGKFPRRLRLGPNRVGWLLSELEAWLASKAKAREPVNDRKAS